jgi:hypothetical protein
VVEVVKGIEPLPKVVGVWIDVVLTGRGGGGGTTPPPATVIMRVRGLLNEVATFASIATHRINYRLGEATLRGTIRIKSGTNKPMIGGFAGLKPSVSRS